MGWHYRAAGADSTAHLVSMTIERQVRGTHSPPLEFLGSGAQQNQSTSTRQGGVVAWPCRGQ